MRLSFRWRRLLLLPFRLAGLAVIFIVLLSLSAALVLRLTFTPERLKVILAAQLQEAFQRPVQLDSVNVVLTQGLQATGLRVLAGPGYPGRDLLTSRVLVVRLKLLPLLHKRIELRELKLWSPSISIIRDAEGRWNVEDLLKRRSRKVNFKIEEAQVADGTVVIDDLRLGRRHELSKVDLKVSQLDLETPCPFEASFRAKLQLSTSTVEAVARGRGSLSLGGGDADRASLEVLDSEWRSGKLSAQLKGGVQGFRTPLFSLGFNARPFKSEDLDLPPGWSLPASGGTIQGSLPGGRRLEVQSADLRAGPLSLTGRGEWDFSTSTASWKVELETSRFDIALASQLWDRAAAWGASGLAKLSVAARGGEDAGLDRVKLALEQANFRWLTMTFSGVNMTLDGSNDLSDAAVRVNDGVLRYHDQQLTEVHGVATIKGRALDVQRADGKWNGQPFSLRSRVSPMIQPERISVSGGFSEVKLDDVTQTIQTIIDEVRAYKGGGAPMSGWWLQIFKKSLPKGFPALSGDITIAKLTHPNFTGQSGRLTWRLAGIGAGLRQLHGQVIVDIGPGRITDVQGLIKSRLAYRIIFLPFTTMQRINQMGILSNSQIENFDYFKIHGDYVFRSGAMTINNFWEDADDMVATTDGNVDWPQETLYLHVITRVNHAKQGAAPESLSDQKGRPTLSFYVDGPMLSPDVRLDMTKVPARHFESFMDDGRKVSDENVRKLVRELW